MGQTIGLISLKGGVGKTTLSASLAAMLVSNFGKKVLLVDANYFAPNLGIHMDIIAPNKTIHDVLTGTKLSSAIHSKYGVDIIPGNFMFNKEISPLKLKSKLAYAKKHYDFVVLDSSPSLNDEVLSTILASDKLFVVSTPDYPTLSCSMRAAKLSKQRNRPISGIIINRVSNPSYEVTLEEIQESTGIPVVAKIMEDKSVGKALFKRVPASLNSKRSKFSKELKKLCIALVGEKEKLGMRKFFRKIKKEEANRTVLRGSFYKNSLNGK
jgi:MinD-like ATPase involved in chromosome partitioning or flagellar assembly